MTETAAGSGHRGAELPGGPEAAERFAALARELTAAAVEFAARAAEQVGLSTTDHRCLHLARNSDGPLTAGQIAELSGLSTGAVTGVIDRLERAGFVRRVRDPYDRRKVRLEVSGREMTLPSAPMGGLSGVLGNVLGGYTGEELRIIERYQRQLIAALRSR